MAADTKMPRYAEITSSQPGWRFVFAILEAEDPCAREVRGAQELPEEEVIKALGDAEQLAPTEFLRPALTSAWAGLDAVMCKCLRASAETASWGTLPRPMLNELYSTGILSDGEFRHLEHVYRLRSRIARCFASPTLDASVVHFVVETARRLLAESQPAKKTA